jgi:hypothetical protein
LEEETTALTERNEFFHLHRRLPSQILKLGDERRLVGKLPRVAYRKVAFAAEPPVNSVKVRVTLEAMFDSPARTASCCVPLSTAKLLAGSLSHE